MRGVSVLLLTWAAMAQAEPASVFFWSDADTPGSGDVYAVSVANDQPLNLTKGVHTEGAWSPEVSPDGTLLAYVARDEENSRGQIWVSDLRLQNRRQLTQGEVHSNPSWAPDGRRIVLRTSTDRLLSDLPDNQCLKGDSPGSYYLGCNDLFVLDLDTGLTTNVTVKPGFDFFAAWSPLGPGIAFLRAHSGYRGDIWLAVDGVVTQITHSGNYLSRPSWAPDGGFLAVGKATENGEGVFILDPSDGEERLLTPAFRIAGEPAWSRDGEAIAFRVWESGEASIWTIRPDGTGIRKLADLSSSTVTSLSWTVGEIPSTAILSQSWGRLKAHSAAPEERQLAVDP